MILSNKYSCATLTEIDYVWLFQCVATDFQDAQITAGNCNCHSRKQQLLLDSLQSADVSTDSENKQLAFCIADASCVNKTEFELLHAAVTSIEAEEGST